MFRVFATGTALMLAIAALVTAQAQDLKSGPQPDSILPGSLQVYNVSGPFAGRYHCLVTEFRLNPVAMVFVRTQPDRIDPEVKKLLEALDKAADDKHGDTGFESFVVFLAPQARSSTTDDTKDVKDNVALAKNAAVDTVAREKFVNFLKEEAKSLKRLVVTCAPPEAVADKYRLAEKAEVTVVIYARHLVKGNMAFAEGQLKQEGVDSVLKGVDGMLERLKKTSAVVR